MTHTAEQFSLYATLFLAILPVLTVVASGF